jgi:hypothetical protein
LALVPLRTGIRGEELQQLRRRTRTRQECRCYMEKAPQNGRYKEENRLKPVLPQKKAA